MIAGALALVAAVAAPALAAGPPPVTGRSLVKSARTFTGDVRGLRSRARPPQRERPEREPPRTPLRPSQSSAPIGTGVFPGAQLPAPGPSSSFEGLAFNEDCGGTPCGDGHPPDTNGDVGPRYYIQTINTAVGIYDKATGTRVAGFSFNALMSQGSFGNLCDTDNFGDPVVVYDSLHDRWVITDFAFQVDGSGNVVSPPGSYQCFAVSRTGDPVAGGWNFYSLHITDALQDYPKFGVWPDGLYMSANMFGFSAHGTFQNSRVWALNLAQMEAGAASPQVVSFDAKSKVQGVDVFTLLPSNSRVQAGTPPAGRPNYFTSVWGWTNRVRVWAFHVDWANTANSTFTGPTDSLTQTVWASPPNTVPSKDGNNLDTLAIRLMVQNQYSNLGGVESLWNSHTVEGSSSSQAAVRWYQVPVTGGTIGDAVQDSTWNPDSSNRFMPSVAVDRAADMAIGYSVSSSTLFPAIRYAARFSSDPPSTLGQTETSMIEGTGAQTGNCGGSACERWGDYSAMTLDPDGCTFWYTNEYYPSSGLNDHTRIGAFKLSNCTPITMGALHGTVTDSATNGAISGATVTAGIYSTTTDSSGAYSFPAIPAGTYSVTANAPGHLSSTAASVSVTGGGDTTRDFALAPGSPTTATKLVFTSSTAGVASGATKTLTVEIRDAADNLVNSDNSTVVNFAQTSGTGSVTGLGNATASGGIAQVTVTGASAGSVSVQATASGLTSATSAFSVTPGAASKLVFTSSTAGVTSGSNKTLTVAIRDASDNLVTSDNSTVVAFAKSAGPGSVTGLGNATASGGIAQKTVTGAVAGSVTITATATGLSSDSTTFSVTPGAASKLVFTSSTAGVTSGSNKTLTVEIHDAADNLVSSDNSTVVAFAKSAGPGSVTGLGNATASGGIAQKTVTGAVAGSVTITATATGLSSDSTTFSVTPGAASKLAFTSSTAGVAAGANKTLTVEIRDAGDNVITSDNSTVVAFAKTAGSGSVTGLGNATASGGIAQKTVTGATPGSVTVTATASGLTSAASTFTVTPGAPTKLVFTSSTAGVASGSNKTLTVEIRDASDNLVTSDNSTVVGFAKSAGSGSVTGLGNATASGGIAQKTVTGAVAGSVTITATASSLSSDTSTFNVIPGSPRGLTFTSSTEDLAAGSTRSLSVEVRDEQGNKTSSSAEVSLASPSGTGTVTGLPATVHALDGVASVPVSGAVAGSIQIAASSPGLTSATTGFTVVPGSADHLTFTNAVADLVSGATRDLRVEVRDANQNVVSSSPAAVALEKSGGRGTASGLPATVTASGGSALLPVAGVGAGPLEIRATSAGLTPATTSFTVVPGSPDHLTFTSPVTELASGDTRDLTVELRDAGENRVDSDATVEFSAARGPGSVEGLPARAGASGGVATRSVTGFLGGSVTIAARAAGLRAGATSFTIAPGPKARRITIKLSRQVLSGKVAAAARACRAGVTVNVERQQTGKRWKTAKRATTSTKGAFKVRLTLPGVYRVVLPVRPGCAAAKSKPTRLSAGAATVAATVGDSGARGLRDLARLPSDLGTFG